MTIARMCVAMLCAGMFATAAVAETARHQEARFMRVHGQAAPPYGFLQFCRNFATECRAQPVLSTRFTTAPEHLSELDEVNRHVNTTIIPATDEEIYGVEEYWTFPKVMGDCEDYVVLKRRILMNRGWPASALLITVVQDEKGEGHAVLTARTTQGDFVLDNKHAEVRLWSQTPYRYVMRQSYINPQVWMSLDPEATASPQALAGVRTR
jgi:predicted transglutaminase-like cysteine proteinase